MGMLGWVIMGLAIWHFTIWLPDRFWGGIVGAFIGSLIGSIVVGLIIYGVKVSALQIPGEKATDIARGAVRRARRADRHGAGVSRGHAPRTRGRHAARGRSSGVRAPRAGGRLRCSVSRRP